MSLTATVTSAPIRISGFFPPGSITNVSGTKAKMLGDTILFDFRSFVPRGNVMFFVVNTVADWTSSPGGVVLALLGEGERLSILIKSGLYLSHINVTGAMNMVRLYGERCAFLKCFHVENGLFAVDYANCTNCNGPFFDAGVQTVSNSENGMTRFQNCTHLTGKDQPFYYANSAHYLFDFGGSGNFVMSSITTDGDLFSVPNKQVSWCSEKSQMVFQHINAKEHGLGFFFFVVRRLTCEVYVGNLTFGGVKYTEPSQFEGIMIGYSKVIDDFGKIISLGWETKGDSTVIGANSLAYCVRSSYEDVTSETIPTNVQNQEVMANGFPPVVQWTRARCVCKNGGFAPYCTEVYDPLLYPVGFAFKVPECTTDPVTCKLCRWDKWDTCGECNPGYKLNDKGECVLKGCHVANCRDCVFDESYKCDHCAEGYFVTADKKCAISIPNCIALSPDGKRCTACRADSGNLVPSENGRSCVTCSVKNCKACSENEKCASCESGYAVDDANQCSIPITGCGVPSNADPKRCTTCEAKYSLVDGSCVSCVVDNCRRCEEKDKCKKCERNHEMKKDGTCEYFSGGCFRLNDGAPCIECKKGFYLSDEDNTCVACSVLNCDTCDSKGKCQQCGTRYNLTNDGNCIECDVPQCSPFGDPHDGKEDTDKGIPWWVWLIVGLGAAVVVGLIIFFVARCCCCAPPPKPSMYAPEENRTVSYSNCDSSYYTDYTTSSTESYFSTDDDLRITTIENETLSYSF